MVDVRDIAIVTIYGHLYGGGKEHLHIHYFDTEKGIHSSEEQQ